MSLIKWSPGFDPFSEMEEIMSSFPRVPALQSVHSAFAPAVDVYEEKNNIIVKADLAGLDPKDVEVTVEKNVVTLRGETKTEHEIEEKNYYRKEIRSGSFFRKVPLPGSVKEEKINAEFCDGVLKITCPKASPAQTKKVDIKVVKNNTKKK
ncbi:MAG: hypothetical protein COV59_04305 [Candidatus Magasanikbacteria bacterium CG11_big_fil_rev_8_21_14_0_20_39_34]|uniref:SHSP domain-containing protein n=1 Tax=Candidatus Magasanikbacteria bacterium CG11_big_fil_rev_8_21_14_0_20_39_34 TaxID=1974653 RepID=A0A2H0N4N7_9BACT|nr:MAG: hypothetical protein COV59_04305 [Candidatus Magasanikbacteria bacterium CG11_big_fil_rev_8_21_14_0_20_39_34]